MNTTIPCTVSDEHDEMRARTAIDAAFEWRQGCAPTRDEPGESTGYVCVRSLLAVTSQLRAIRSDCYCVRIENGQPVLVTLNPDHLEADAVAIDDDDLHAALVAYLEE